MELAVTIGSVNQFVTRLLTICVEVINKSGVGRDNVQHLAGTQAQESFLSLQYEHRTIQPPCINFCISNFDNISIFHNISICDDLSLLQRGKL
jgi:hypothetical protein